MTDTKRQWPATRIARALLLGYLLALALLVLWPGEDHAGGGVVMFFARIIAGWGAPLQATFLTLEFLANIVLFVPFGLLVPLAIGSVRAGTLWLTVLAGFALTVVIEWVQGLFEGRVSDPRDVVANSLGTVLGVLLLVLFTSRRRASIERRVRTPDAH